MNHRALGPILLLVSLTAAAVSQNTRQAYSGKIGFYSPSDGLNNGLMLGADGITEFLKYDFFLNLSADLYFKQSFNFFKDPKPEVVQQQIILIPLSVGGAYELFDVPDADSRGYIGAGVGYYLYFYAVEYKSTSGGILGGTFSQTDSKNGGNFFAVAFVRILINQIFVEPKLYVASKKEDSVGSHPFVVNPSGFSIALGFQY
ncbi:MAG TPA: hypothetical protein VGA55_01790 [Bacteroidota bacterium]